MSKNYKIILADNNEISSIFTDDEFIEVCDELFENIELKLLPRKAIAVCWELSDKDRAEFKDSYEGVLKLNNGGSINYISDDELMEEAVDCFEKRRVLVFHNAIVKAGVTKEF